MDKAKEILAGKISGISRVVSYKGARSILSIIHELSRHKYKCTKASKIFYASAKMHLLKMFGTIYLSLIDTILRSLHIKMCRLANKYFLNRVYIYICDCSLVECTNVNLFV